ncbi:MAG TPA: prepilin-type N-terminal cleavage/methylation domain-containing protein, partial [Candidatus Rifleibacterium sp.]|nr:prepilin-type N-terminal cleavage/methylation domain-containing protein [Candidatus Rifleibacterium sp.]
MIKRAGFTLIELLVVITILAILVGAALPYVQNYVAESRLSKAKSDLEEIKKALAIYETREG